MGSGFVEQAFGAGANQLASMWDFSISGAADDAPWSKIMTFEVEDVSLPFPRLTTEKLANGENYYSGIEFPNEVSITLRETIDFTSLSYFQEWFDEVYDLDDRVFLSYAGAKKGSSQDKVHRQGKLTFHSFDMSSKRASEMIYQKENFNSYSDVILKKQEINNILFGAARNVISSAQSMVTDLTRTVGFNLGSGWRPKVPTMKVPIPVFKLGSGWSVPLSTVNPGGWTERDTYVFTLDNLSIIGVEDLSLSYGEGGPLLVKVNMVAENVSGKKGGSSVAAP
jgi:hypothetical protein